MQIVPDNKNHIFVDRWLETHRSCFYVRMQLFMYIEIMRLIKILLHDNIFLYSLKVKQ